MLLHVQSFVKFKPLKLKQRPTVMNHNHKLRMVSLPLKNTRHLNNYFSIQIFSYVQLLRLSLRMVQLKLLPLRRLQLQLLPRLPS